MDLVQLPEPSLRSVVPVDSVAEQLAELGATLDQLTREVRQLEAEADEAERRAETGDLDSPFARRTSRLAAQLVEQLRSDARDEHRDALRDERERAAARVDAATVQAGATVAAARTDVAEALLAGSTTRPPVIDLTRTRPSVEVDPGRHEHPAGADLAASVPGAHIIDSAVAAAVAAAVSEVDIPAPPTVTPTAVDLTDDVDAGDTIVEAEASVAPARRFFVAQMAALLLTLALLVAVAVVFVVIG